MRQQTKAYLYALSAVALWSTVASAFKLSLRQLDSVQLLLWSNLFSVLCLLGVLAAQRRLGQLRAVSRRELGRCARLGLLNPLLYYLVLFKAYELLPAQEAQPLNYTWALTLALLSIPLLKQKIGRWDLLALLISYAGVVVIATRGDPLALRLSDPLGVVLALGSTIIWSLYWIANTRDPQDAVLRLTLSFACSLPLALGVALVFSDLRISWPGLLGAAYVGAFEMGFTFVLWLKALRLSTTTARVSNLIFFSPFLSLALIHLLVGERILPSTLPGLVLIVAGNLVQRLVARGKEP